MRLAEEEKLRKEMSAKKAKEEAERKHQVSGGGPTLHCPFAGRRPSPDPGCAALSFAPFFACALGASWPRTEAGGPWLRGARVPALRSSFSRWETAPR